MSDDAAISDRAEGVSPDTIQRVRVRFAQFLESLPEDERHAVFPAILPPPADDTQGYMVGQSVGTLSTSPSMYAYSTWDPCASTKQYCSSTFGAVGGAWYQWCIGYYGCG